ncbi:MAG: DNA gyrase modulator, partial [Rhizomicrobium sp.]
MTADLFFSQAALDRPRIEALVSEALQNADDGELFLEQRHSETFYFDDGRLKSVGSNTVQGFGLRAVCG